MITPQLDSTKRETIERLTRAGVTAIMLDARQPGVDVPSEFRVKDDLILNISHNFDPPDLRFNDWGISATLSFSGTRYPCRVPWSAIYVARTLALPKPQGCALWHPPPEPPKVTVRKGGLGVVS